ncbi:hypothetical protein R6Q57_026854 [Mikania cordata]
MDSDIHHHHHNHNHNQQLLQQQQQNMNSGLTRYRSAPSSYFSNLTTSDVFGNEDFNPFFNPLVSSPESERILSRFMSGGEHIDQIRRNEFTSSTEQMMSQNHARSQEVVHNNKSDIDPQMNLLRQSSSPAGFFEQINVDKGYAMMRSMDRYPPANGIVPDSSFASATRSSSRPLYRIPEHEGSTMTRNNGGYVAWDKSSILTDGFLNEFAENDHISSSENQEHMVMIQSIHVPTGLTHQLSLPTELSGNEKPVQFQDNVPFRSRAKRGCATHPRSIAERVRRTRISERMRKLQDLVPNMDKQTSTADMLDLAVDYIKELQKLVETLSERRTKCTCHNKLKP